MRPRRCRAVSAAACNGAAPGPGAGGITVGFDGSLNGTIDCGCRDVTATRQPRATTNSDVTRPIPEEAPVISAVLAMCPESMHDQIAPRERVKRRVDDHGPCTASAPT